MSQLRVGQKWDRGEWRDLLLRPIDGSPDDLSALARVRNATLEGSLPPGDYREWGAEEIDRFYNRADYSLQGNAWLLLHGDEPIGAAVVYPRAFFSDRPPGNFDLYVVPHYARHGLGTRLLTHTEQAAKERGHRTLETTVAREDAHSNQFLKRMGFRAVGQSTHLRRDPLDGIEAPDWPEGYRAFSLSATEDADPDLYIETANRLASYDANYSLLSPATIEEATEAGTWEPTGIFFLLDSEERIVGVIRASGAQTGRGYLHEIRLEPASRRKGLGTALVRHALRYLVEVGVRSAELDTTGAGTPAHSLAERCGFRVTTHWLHYLKPLGNASEGTARE
jgi:GNAT superfamily N-acetyltransferase